METINELIVRAAPEDVRIAYFCKTMIPSRDHYFQSNFDIST